MMIKETEETNEAKETKEESFSSFSFVSLVSSVSYISCTPSHPYTPTMRLAIVADWLVTFGGAEHVLAQCADMFPDAPLYTTVARPDAMGPLAGKTIHTSRLQRWY